MGNYTIHNDILPSHMSG